MSHTLTVKAKITNAVALEATVKSMGGEMLGQGSFRLFSSQENGVGFRLPGWQYPLVARPDGSLAYDDYHGSWGNAADITELTERYQVECAKGVAQNMGWMWEPAVNGGIVIHLPTGETVSVERSGTVDAHGFVGPGCADVTNKIAEAMGQITSDQRKLEYESALVQATEIED